MDWSANTIANVVGGTLVLIFLIWQIIQKVSESFGWFEKQKSKRQEKQHLELERDVSKIIKEKILPPIMEKMEAINAQQSHQLNCLINSSNDMLRANLNAIYYKYLPQKKMPAHDWKLVTLLYRDYKSQDGNTYIDEIYFEMRDWEHTA